MALKLPGFGKKSTEHNTTLIMGGLKPSDKIAPLPIIGHLPVERQYLLTMFSALTFLVITGLLIILGGVQTANKTGYITRASEMQMLTQQISKSAMLLSNDDQTARHELDNSRAQFSSDLDTLTNGGLGLPASPQQIQPTLNRLQENWRPLQSTLISLENSHKLEKTLPDSLTALQNQISTLQSQLGETQATAPDTPSTRLSNELSTLNNALIAWHQVLNNPSATPAKQLNQLLQQTDQSLFTIHQLGELLNKSGNPHDAVVAGQNLEKSILPIKMQLHQFAQARAGSMSVRGSCDNLLTQTRELSTRYQQMGTISNVAAFITGLLGIGSLVLFGFVNNNESRRRVQTSEAENKRNQEAILRLLNELGDLADGDLTANATVTEDITGAIADSINFTIDELRTLVDGITKATEQVTQTTIQAQSVSEDLLNAASRQSTAIEETSAEVFNISQSINAVSASATQSAQVATQSLEAAEKGTHAVENSIAGMNSIRENIQETSKRIKRLGESSQEIGEIVELISDITEQTNVLALNAAIQAAAAGEAGRGFSVVAEEVQRLAERSAQATKQISAIVKTIQSDTLDAISAMEISTQGVVEGARLSDGAGQALHEIEAVTHNLAELISSISLATDSQTMAASKVAESMQYIQKITEQTMTGTKQTADSIGELTGLATNLRKSISGFKLN